MGTVFVLRRIDTNQFYKGSNSYMIENRWDSRMSKAKKFKRSCDVSNALTGMRQSGYTVKEHPWLTTPGNFVIETYEMTKVSERIL